MKKFIERLILIITTFAFVSCGQKQMTQSEVKTIEIKDARGVVNVPVNPERVVSLDNRSFQTLEQWGIKLAAVPKNVMPKESSYVTDENVKNIGNHREPNLEVIAEVNPQLVIVGQRFAKYYDKIKEIVPNATVIDLNIDLSKENQEVGKSLINGFRDYTLVLGQIFNKESEAKKLVEQFDSSMQKAKSTYNPENKVMSLIVTGGKIRVSSPKTGRVFGPLYEVMGWTPALVDANSTTNHKGDEISLEAIASANPDFLLVLDRDAAIANNKDSIPAKDVIFNSQVLATTNALKNKKVVIAPLDTYTNESIQTFIEIFDSISEAQSE